MTSYGELINILPNECKKLIRLRESIIKKIINAELSITFNQTYIYIYIYGRRKQASDLAVWKSASWSDFSDLLI